MNQGKIFLIPSPISENGLQSISRYTQDVILVTKYYVVEKIKTARRYFKACHKEINIDELSFFELDKNSDNKELGTFLQILKSGHNVGVVSEAGCPAIADPGNIAIAWAHQNNIEVVPLAGPSSILMALIASGFNGQKFTFHGYVPIQKSDLSNLLKRMENEVRTQNITQIFMETPYRNGAVLEQCCSALQLTTKLCIACDVDSETQFIKTMPIAQWKKFDSKDLHKRLCVFVIGR